MDPALAAYTSALKNYFRKRAHAAEIDDLTQEVFLNMQSRRRVARIDNLQGYLFSVAARVLSRHYTRRRAETLYMRDAVERCDPLALAPSAEDEVLLSETLERLCSTLQNLSPRTRHAFLLHRLDAHSYESIARHLEISVSTIEKDVMNALRAIRSHMSGDA